MNKMKKVLLFSLIFVMGFQITINAKDIDTGYIDKSKKDASITNKTKLYKPLASGNQFGVSGSYETTSDFYFGYVNTDVDLVVVSANEVYYEKNTNEVYQRSYYKKVTGNKWFQYKNTYSDYNNNYIITYFHYDATKCNASTEFQYSKSCQILEKNKGRISKIDYYDGYNFKIGKYRYRALVTYPNSNTREFSNWKEYGSDKKLSFNETRQFKNNKVSYLVFYNYWKGRIIEKRTVNYITKTGKSVQKDYHSNNKMKMYAVYNYKVVSSYYLEEDLVMTSGFIKKYDSKQRRVAYYIYKKKEPTYIEERKYYSNNKTKTKLVIKSTVKGKTSAAYYTKYNSKGKKKYYKRLYYNKYGNPTKMNYYKYNKKGQLKSNKYGNAYKYISTIKKGIVVKVTKAQYNYNGKLGFAKVVKKTKATSIF